MMQLSQTPAGADRRTGQSLNAASPRACRVALELQGPTQLDGVRVLTECYEWFRRLPASHANV